MKKFRFAANFWSSKGGNLSPLHALAARTRRLRSPYGDRSHMGRTRPPIHEFGSRAAYLRLLRRGFMNAADGEKHRSRDSILCLG